MNQIDAFELERISQAISDLKACTISHVIIPEKIKYRAGKMEPEREKELVDFYPFDSWGGFDEYGWFRCEFTVPEIYEGRSLWVEISQDKRDWYAQNPQFLLWCNGEPVQGMDIYHEECMLRECARAGETLCLDFDAWSGMSIRDRSWSDRENRKGMFSIRFYSVEPLINKLYYDLKTPYEAAKYVGRESDAGLKIVDALTAAVNAIDMRQPGSRQFFASAECAEKILQEMLYADGESLNAIAASIGHTHIDVAWMWQFSHTRMKTQRSFDTALKLLEEYPEYVFMSSQPQLYEYLKEAQPEQFEKVRAYVKAGRWEPEGGMWVEADCNLTSGESLIRQFLEGKRYFREEFGSDNKVLWLPDVFGYSAALPQICKKCGIDYFMTTKISWNEVDKIPFDTFLWKGIDGTEILTHFAPAKQFDAVNYNPFGFARSPHITTYNGVLEPDYVMGGWKRYSQKALNTEFLLPYGYGDGGGGTTREMIEKGRRMERGIPGCPKVKFSTVLQFFKELEDQVINEKKLPVWNGELYLEFHRGTYTTAGIIKRLNRKAENLLQCAEFLMSAAEYSQKGYCWDKQEWRKAIRAFLTNQFHDILPGSSITAVYDDVKGIYREIFQVFRKNAEDALEGLMQEVPEGKLAVINTLGFSRNGKLEFSCQSKAPVLRLNGEDGTSFYAQNAGQNSYVTSIRNVPAGSISLFDVQEVQNETENPWKWDGETIENAYIRVKFANDGTLESIFDKEEQREVLSAPANVLETYEDRPYQYDAWELSPYYREKMYCCSDLTSSELVEMGPVRACVRQKRKYLSSEICQDIYFYSDSKRIDFHTIIEWRESHILLKAAFPADVLADQATYEIQFGTVQRPTHTNTSWDAEKFETCAQRFADLSEPDYGAALLNDCKYGYDIHDGVIRLTLLRSPSFPNDIDKGIHEFTYSFMPHKGDYRRAEIQKEAYDLNRPLISAWGSGKEAKKAKKPAYQAPMVCDCPGVFMETLKPAEDGDGLIARCYEGFGCRQHADMRVIPGWCVTECNMLEEELEGEKGKRKNFSCMFRPFEIKTFRITPVEEEK